MQWELGVFHEKKKSTARLFTSDRRGVSKPAISIVIRSLITIIQFNRIKCQLCYKSFENAMPHTWQFSHNLFPTSEYIKKKHTHNLTQHLSTLKPMEQQQQQHNYICYLSISPFEKKNISNVISSNVQSSHRFLGVSVAIRDGAMQRITKYL